MFNKEKITNNMPSGLNVYLEKPDAGWCMSSRGYLFFRCNLPLESPFFISDKIRKEGIQAIKAELYDQLFNRPDRSLKGLYKLEDRFLSIVICIVIIKKVYLIMI